MAEFCFECWKKMTGKDERERDYIITKDLDLCEGCGELKRVVIAKRKDYYCYKFRCLILPFRIFYAIFYWTRRLIKHVYSKKNEKANITYSKTQSEAKTKGKAA